MRSPVVILPVYCGGLVQTGRGGEGGRLPLLLHPSRVYFLMAASSARLLVPATTTSLAVVKARLAGATKGHALLKKRADALTMRFRALIKALGALREKVSEAQRSAAEGYLQARVSMGEGLKDVVAANVANRATFGVNPSADNVAGVRLPTFAVDDDNAQQKAALPEAFAMLGLAKGGQQLHGAAALYAELARLYVEMASLQTSFFALDEAIKTTNRRVNALENVVKPKLANTIHYIKGELDELEREEFFRLKKVQAKKKKDVERAAAAAADADAAEPPSLLAADADAAANGDDDADLIF